MRGINTHKSRRSDPGPSIWAEEELGPGGAPHRYEIVGMFDRNPASVDCAARGTSRIEIVFQHGGVPDNGVNGVTIEALLAICIDRLEHFQRGPFPHDRNADALEHLKWAVVALHARTRERYRRGVEGKEEA